MADIFPPLYETPIGQVRLLIPDTAQDANGEYVFTDDQIQALLSLHRDNIKRAAARAIDTIANDTAMLLKIVRTDDLSVDGVKVSAELRAHARNLRDEADADDLEDAYDVGFQIIYPHRSLHAEATPWAASQYVSGDATWV